MQDGKTILLVLSSERGWQNAASAAIETATRRAAGLFVLFVIEESAISYPDRLDESNFISRQAAKEMREVLAREKRQSGYNIIEKISDLLKGKNIVLKSSLVTGEIINETQKFSKATGACEIIISWPKQGIFRKILKGDISLQLSRSTGIPVTAIEE